MTEPAKRIPKWLRLDIAVLVVGAVIILAATRDGIVQRVAQGAQSTGQQLWQYVTERKKPVVPKLKAPL
jgi:hypothetical protein